MQEDAQAGSTDSSRRIPVLVNSRRPEALLAVLSAFAVADDLARQGQCAEAAGYMLEHSPALALSAEGNALLALRRVRWLRHGGDLGAAQAALQEAQLSAAFAHPAAKPQLLADCVVQQARLTYDLDPNGAVSRISFRRIEEHIGTARSAQMQWESANLQALVCRRKLEAQRARTAGAGPTRTDALLQLASDCFDAAFFWLVASGDAHHLRAVLANYAYHLQWLIHQKMPVAEQIGLGNVIDAWRLSQTIAERFDLPENSAWNYIMLADLWLQHPQARYLLQTDARLWPRERSPAHLDFYQRALELAHDTGNLRQRLLAMDRCAAFLLAIGNARLAVEYKQRRDRLLNAHAHENPELRHEPLLA